MAPLRLGSVAPDFSAETTTGPIKFHDFIGDSWAVLFSHPADFTPVCTTELGEVAKLAPQFAKRGVKVIGLSTNDLADHDRWVDDINKVNNVNLAFPIIADKDRDVATLYDMLDSVEHDASNVVNGIPFTVRSVFVIDPAKKIRLILTYPASCGRNFDEILRAIDSLQLSDRQPIATPANWQPGGEVIVHVSVSTEKAKQIFPEVREALPYLRFATLPAEEGEEEK
ncbi:peroxiredoxin 1 [Kickxella alabastrina]|uniref:Peroxiredoxin 1 n=1 Tax=Kickxella alabastrina TaxID=61397 RepID=A0ACC1ISU1_9FUNG|nr:peroxiredoxin 1 [Kickxella alabastrina]